MTFNVETSIPPGAKIKVIGVGGGGGNAVNTMIKSNLDGVEFIVANTDLQSLRFALAPTKIQLGKALTKGLGAGADPDVGREAALEDRHEIAELLEGTDMVFITAGMGGGTGTGAAAVISQIARELGALTVGVVTKPFDFEGKRRRRHAELGIERLKDCVDTLITIPNQKLLQIATPDLTMMDAFKMADNVLVNAVRGISDIINVPGTVNVDFADVKTVMSSMGHALMGIGIASGEKRAVQAAKQAICSPLLEDIDIEGATGILINITASSNISLLEISEACSIIQDAAHEEANIIFGAAIDEELGDEIRVTVIATGFPMDQHEEREPNLNARRAHDMNISAASKKPILGQNTPSYPKPMTNAGLINPTRKNPERIMETPILSQERMGAAASPAVETASVTQPSLPLQPAPQLQEAEELTRLTMLSSSESNTNAFEPGISELNADNNTSTEHVVDTERVLFSDEAMAFDVDRLQSSQFDDDFGYEEWPKHNLHNDLNVKRPEMDVTRMQGDISNKIDEALDIAERLHHNLSDPQIAADDLDIPAFIRNGMKDIPIS